MDAATFKEFAEPGFAKTVYALGARPTEDGKTLLWAIMRTATTDDPARTWFRRYWTFGVGYGAHVFVHGLLDVVRDDAESRARWSSTSYGGFSRGVPLGRELPFMADREGEGFIPPLLLWSGLARHAS